MPASQYLSTLKEEGFMESWVCLFKCLWIVDTSVAWVFHTPACLHLRFVMLMPPPLHCCWAWHAGWHGTAGKHR